MTANTLLNSQEVRKLPAGALFKAIFVISYISQKSDKNGKPYYDVTATDGLGTVEAKVWSDAQWLDKSEASPQSDDDKLPPERIVQLTGRTVGVNGKVAEYRGLLQFNFNKITLLNQEKYPPAGYLPHSPIPVGELAARFEALVGECQGEAGKFLRFVFGGDRWTRFRDWPAAVSHHHAYANGLLEHTVSVAACAKAMAESMAASGYDVDKEIVIAGALLHDIGKLESYRMAPVPEITVEGALPALLGARRAVRPLGKTADAPLAHTAEPPRPARVRLAGRPRDARGAHSLVGGRARLQDVLLEGLRQEPHRRPAHLGVEQLDAAPLLEKIKWRASS